MHKPLILLTVLACTDKDDSSTTGDTADTADTSAPTGAVLDPSFFADSPALISAELVECEKKTAPSPTATRSRSAPTGWRARVGCAHPPRGEAR